MDQIREHLGTGAEKVGRHGLTGAAGVDISSSLSIGVGVPKSMMDFTGAIGGAIESTVEAGAALQRKEFSKAAEAFLPTGIANPIRAYREAQEGVTTRRNYPVFDETGQLRPTPLETVKKPLDSGRHGKRLFPKEPGKLKGRLPNITKSVMSYTSDIGASCLAATAKSMQNWSKMFGSITAKCVIMALRHKSR